MICHKQNNELSSIHTKEMAAAGQGRGKWKEGITKDF